MSLKLGDTVVWCGAWGTQPPKEAVVDVIEINVPENGRYGTEVDEIPIKDLKRTRCIIGLVNGSWAYGYQIDPISEEAP